MQALEERATTLEAAIVPLSEKEADLREKLPDTERLVEEAIEHANNLARRAEELERYL